MQRVAIEFCDPGVALVRRREAPFESPGVALLSPDEALRVGAEAVARARLAPRSVQNRFWDRLGLDALPTPVEGVTTVADLAAAHLLDLWRAAASERDEALLVVPGSFEREQLGVLLGVVQSCGIPASGMVDAAVAAVATLPELPDADAQMIHVDVLLHRTLITQVERRAGFWERGEVMSHRPLGIASLRDLWAKFAADLFVRATRFDPLHRAESEQALYDRLPAALAALCEQTRAPLELATGDASHTVVLEREQVGQVAGPQYERLKGAIEATRDRGRPLVLVLSSRAASLPGLAARLRESGARDVLLLGAGAAGLGALEHEDEVCSGEGGLALVTSLRLDADAAVAGVTRSESPTPQPTHLLVGDHAHPIGALPLRLVVDVSEPGGARVGSGAEIDTLEVLRDERGVRAEATGELAWQHNGRPAEDCVALALGDRLQLAEGALLRLIALATGDAP